MSALPGFRQDRQDAAHTLQTNKTNYVLVSGSGSPEISDLKPFIVVQPESEFHLSATLLLKASFLMSVCLSFAF